MKTFKFRLQPSKSQRTKLKQTLEWCRLVYNSTLSTRKNAWEAEKRSVSLYDTNKMLTSWKGEYPDLKQVHSQVLQNVQERVDLAFQSYFRRVKAGAEKVGYPRFKGYGRYDSFTFKQSGFELLDNGVMVSKIGAIKIIQHRPIEGRIKTLNIQRDAVGNWYACFSCEVEPTPLPFNDLAVGIDVGLTTFATLSNGITYDNPRFFRRDEVELGRAQRRWDKDKTPQRRKVIAHIHQRIANRRKDFAHKLSRELVNSYGAIFFENLTIKNMMHTCPTCTPGGRCQGNHRLAKSIGAAAWSQLIQYCTYKAVDAGRAIVLVDPRGTSQRCSGCGLVVQKDLSVRVHDCPSCGLVMDRDLNASLNIEALGLESLGYALKAPAFRRGE
jgi:putative transposase